MTSNSSKKQTTENGFSDAANSDFNNIESVESVYSEDAIEIIDVINTDTTGFDHSFNEIDPAHSFSTEQPAANDDVAQAEIYSLGSERRAKLDKSLERRASKSRLTDRRQSMRLNANGKPEQDRREENRVANIEAIRLAGTQDQNVTDQAKKEN